MRNIIIITMLITFALSLSMIVGSCKKKKPRIGYYYGIFTYDGPSGVVKTAEIEITESTKDKIVINGSTLKKDGKKIEGKIIDLPFSPFGIDIKGEWSHKLFSKEYTIEGDFTETAYTHGGVFTYSGTFVIKSD